MDLSSTIPIDSSISRMNNILIGFPSGTKIPFPFMEKYTESVALSNGDTQHMYNHRGTNAVTARNQCVYECLNGDYTHLFFMDSDMIFPPKTLERLLKHDLDMVGGFYVRKRNEFYPTAFKLGERPNGKYRAEWINDLREVEAIGTGCLLIKRKVLEAVGCPWFEYKWNGEPTGKMITEDLVFCDKVKRLGFKIYCDGTIKCGHVGDMILWPMDKEMTTSVEPV